MDRRAGNLSGGKLASVALAFLALAPCILLPAGCAQSRLPAIDPSGERIFVPGTSTTLAGPFQHEAGFFGHRPAFVTPADPPPCDFVYSEPSDPCNAILGTPIPCPTDCPPGIIAPGPVVVQPTIASPGLVISPGSLISPVGTEVLLTAGHAEKHGLCKGGERIEWMLSQDSVGSFVEIGDPNDHLIPSFLLHRQPKKLSSNYAIGYASKNGERVTRGTPDPCDDATVPVGHSWLTLTSATEGASHVTAFAPDVTGTERRQQTATVYWIDAQWAFPPPAIARAGEKQLLTTAVTRSTNGSPLAGWIVRYEAIGGPGVGFGTGGERVVEVQTNPSGQASVEVFPTSREAGVTQIAISVIRPAGADGLAATTVGQGSTTITWSAPSLAVRLTGPEIAEVGSTATYRIEVANPGDIAAGQVTVSDLLPAALQYVSSTPAAQVLGDRIVWNLGDLAPKATTVIELNCRAAGSGDIRHCAQARTADGLTAESCFVTRVFVRSLALNVTGPQAADVGQNVEFRLEIANRGSTLVRNVVVKDRYDAGLRHELPSPIDRVVGDIQPGETKGVALVFQVVAPGQLCHTMEVSGDGEQTVVARACLTAAQAAAPAPAPRNPRLSIRHAATEAARVNEGAEYAVEATNSGDVALSNVRIAIALPQSVSPTNASPNHGRQQNTIYWVIAQLAPGQTDQKRVQVACRQPDPRACARATVQSDQTQPEAQDACVRIDAGAGGAAAPPPPAGAADPPVVTGNLKVEVFEVADPIRLNNETTYFVTITNGRNAADRDVQVALQYTDGLANPRVQTQGITILRANQRGVDLTPISELRAGERVQIQVKLTGSKVGEQQFRVDVVSQRQQQAVSATEGTTVNPQ